MHIERIDETSPYLASVKALWRANSSTLGFFTDGAFREHATRYGIYVAIMPEVGCVAYLLYRISRSRVMVTHLCVARGWQGHGIARALVDSLRAQTRQFRGIGLRCRRDYYASRIWPHLGFIPLSDQRGKSIDGKELTFWWLDNNHPDIWTAADMQLLESKIAVVIDPESGESKALLADWLQDSIELCVTEEIYNEINRNQDSQHRAQMRQFVHHFTVLRTDSTAFETAFSNLRPIFPEDMEDSDWSDLRQVARAIAAGRQFFVTRDTTTSR
jgi:GNAT superfamily N-acetyltransferase